MKNATMLLLMLVGNQVSGRKRDRGRIPFVAVFLFRPTDCMLTTISGLIPLAGKWELALRLVDEMRECGVKPTVVTYTTAMAACGRGGQYTRALSLLREMDSYGVAPNRWCYGTAIWCCAKGGEVEQVLELLREMKRRGLMPDEGTYRAATMGQRWEVVERVKEEMKGLVVDGDDGRKEELDIEEVERMQERIVEGLLMDQGQEATTTATTSTVDSSASPRVKKQRSQPRGGAVGASRKSKKHYECSSLK